jgi:hypothetical protein
MPETMSGDEPLAGWMTSHRPCPRCKSHALHFWQPEVTDELIEEEKHLCKGCEHVWWVDSGSLNSSAGSRRA